MKKTGIVLAGGKSSRFGTNKAIYYFQGKTMLKHSIDLLKNFCDQILISGDQEEYYVYDYPCIPDQYAGIGPLGGISSCLNKSDSNLNIIVTCDMPLITEDMIAKLLLGHQSGKITIFQDEEKIFYPFPAIIERKYLSIIRRMINEKKYQYDEFLKSCGYISVLLTAKEVRCMVNVNSCTDLIIVDREYKSTNS